MARIINGMSANTPEEKKAAVESAGGVYNENIQGDYIEGKQPKEKESQPKATNNQSRNYVENLEGDYIVNGKSVTTKKSGWFD